MKKEKSLVLELIGMPESLMNFDWKALQKRLSPKQREVWKNTIEKYHRWNVSYGATRSGKTYLDYYKIPRRIQAAGSEGLILLLGNTQGTLERNILDPLRQIWKEDSVGRINSRNLVHLFGREAYALGADKISQVQKIQGASVVYCYGDEVPTWHPEVFNMLKSRLDKPRSCFDGTGNPAHPQHWFKKFLDSDADIFQMGFTIDDNPFLDPEFVANLKKEYRGTVLYDRFILGLWVAAEGVIYRLFADSPDRYILDRVPEDIIFSTIGIDFGGNKSGHSFQCTGFTQNFKQVVTLDEFYTKDELTPADLEKKFVEFVRQQLRKGYRPTEIFADSAEQVLIRGLRNALKKAGIGIPIRNAVKGKITDRIRLYLMLIGCDRYKVVRHCKETIEAFSTAVWDEAKAEDVRLDNGLYNIDTLDAQEYSTEKYAKQLIDLMMLGG